MQRHSFSLLSSIVLFDQPYSITAKNLDGTVVLTSPDGSQREVSNEFLPDQYVRGNCRVVPSLPVIGGPTRAAVVYARPLSSYSPKARNRAEEKGKLIQTLEAQGLGWHANSERFVQAVKAACSELKISRVPCIQTLQTWRRQVGRSSDVRALAPSYSSRGGAGRSRSSAEVVRLMDRATDDIFLASEGATAKSAYLQLEAQLLERNENCLEGARLKIPSYDAFRQHIKRRSAYEIHAGKYGVAAARKKFRHSTMRVAVQQLLEVVEVDHTPLDLFVIDPGTGLPYGRARLTIMLDKASRCVLGFSIGYDGTNAQAVLNCLRHAVLPKTYLKERYPEVQREWPAYGMPGTLVVDNGADFHAESLKRTCEDLGITLQYCPVKRPEYKGSVERFFRTINSDLMGSLPGATLGHFYKRKNEVNPAELAVIDLPTLEKLIHIWICDVYHLEMHRGLGSSPAKAWAERQNFAELELPADPSEMAMLCSLSEERSLWHYGIELHNVKSFNSTELQELRRALEFNGPLRVRVRWDPASMARCYVEDPRDGSWMTVSNDDPQTSRLSQWQLRLAMKVQREFTTPAIKCTIATALDRIRQLARTLLVAKNMRARKRALKMLGLEDGDSSADPAIDASPAAKRRERVKVQRRENERKVEEIVGLLADVEVPTFSIHEYGLPTIVDVGGAE